MFYPTEENTSSVTDMRRDAAGLIKDVKKKGIKYIYQNSKFQVAMVNGVMLKRLIEAFEDWEDQQRIYEIEKEPLGKGVSLEDVAKEFGIKLHNKVQR